MNCYMYIWVSSIRILWNESWILCKHTLKLILPLLQFQISEAKGKRRNEEEPCHGNVLVKRTCTEIGVQLCKARLILNVETRSTIYGRHHYCRTSTYVPILLHDFYRAFHRYTNSFCSCYLCQVRNLRTSSRYIRRINRINIFMNTFIISARFTKKRYERKGLSWG